MEVSASLSLQSFCRLSPSSSSSSISFCKSLAFNNGGAIDLLNKKKKNQNQRLVLNRSSKPQKGLSCRCMFGLGVPEIVVIAGVATLLFGPKKLPEIGRSFGQTFKSFQQAAREFESELKKETEPDRESEIENKVIVSEEENGVKVPRGKESL